MQKTEVEEAVVLLQQHGILEQQSLAKVPELSLEALKSLLTKQVSYLLERNFERLLQAMYRIDVPEQRFRASLTSDDPAGQIAELVLQRELQKVETRRWYANRANTPA